MTSLVLNLLWLSLILALVPAVLFHLNLSRYQLTAPVEPGTELSPVSVLIPARNEEHAIGPAVRAVLANRGTEFEVVVLDDHSEDSTADVVTTIARSDPRVRLVSGPELPVGWCGKQHACWVLAQEAHHPILVFQDADVRLAPDALTRMSQFLESSGADLASGIPRQETGVFAEKLVIPLIHFVLLGFLPLDRMRRHNDSGFAAGCGQLFITSRSAYERSGGHAAIRATLHDGIKLPRAYRAAGLRTDLFDATDLAVCRMYQSLRALWSGLAKNAGEGLAAPTLIVPITLILVGGQVLPVVLIGLALASLPARWPWWALAVAGVAAAAAYYPRVRAVARFQQSPLGALLHPIGILMLLAIQWYAFLRNLVGKRASWKGRPYPARPAWERVHGEQPTR